MCNCLYLLFGAIQELSRYHYCFAVQDIGSDLHERPAEGGRWQESLCEIMNGSLDPMWAYPPPGVDIENPVYQPPDDYDLNEQLAEQILAMHQMHGSLPRYNNSAINTREKRPANHSSSPATINMAKQLHMAANVLEYIDMQNRSATVTKVYQSDKQKTCGNTSSKSAAKCQSKLDLQKPKRSQSQPVFQNQKSSPHQQPDSKKVNCSRKTVNFDGFSFPSNPTLNMQPQHLQRHFTTKHQGNPTAKPRRSRRHHSASYLPQYYGPMSPYANELLRLSQLNIKAATPTPPNTRRPPQGGFRTKKYQRARQRC